MQTVLPYLQHKNHGWFSDGRMNTTSSEIMLRNNLEESVKKRELGVNSNDELQLAHFKILKTIKASACLSRIAVSKFT